MAFMGIMLYFFKPKGVTVDDNPLLPFYEVSMAFWAIFFLAVSLVEVSFVFVNYYGLGLLWDQSSW